MPTIAEHEKKIINILRSLPHNKADELVDFAEYLKTKQKPATTSKTKKQAQVPTYHLGRIEKNAFDRDALYGEHLDRKFD